jgi:hypothetical protein
LSEGWRSDWKLPNIALEQSAGSHALAAAQQKQRFLEDFAKLRNTPAELKYLFVTEARTYEILVRRYAPQNPGVQIVLLSGCVDGSV